MKSTYNPILEERDKLIAVLKQKQVVEAQEKEKEILRAEEIKLEAEKKRLTEINQKQAMFEEQAGLKRYRLEKEMWEEKYKAELAMVEKKLKAEKISHQDQAKLPKLQITQFNGTAVDWVRFENMFITQVDKKQTSDEVKFGYLLEMVCPHVRSRTANLKPGILGYKTAWERLCREYGQTQMVVNAHVSEIINLAAVKGTNFERVNDFHQKLIKSYDALQTLGKSDTLTGLVMTTIDKLPHVKPDLVRTDENWEKWDMGDMITNLEEWIKRNKPSETSSNVPDNSRFKKEKHWFTSGRETQPSYARKQGPHCLFL